MRLFIFVVLFACSSKAHQISSDTDACSDGVIDLINSINTTWKAGKNFDGLSLSQMKNLFMSSEESLTSIKKDSCINSTIYLKKYKSFDARDKWPHCPSIGKIFAQGLCSLSWIYASFGQMADRLCVKYGEHIDVETTVLFTMLYKRSYSCKSEFNSADMAKAFQYWEKSNIVIKDRKNCSPFSCFTIRHSDNDSYAYRKVTYYQPLNESQIQLEILSNGPMIFHIDVYLDLLYYKSGVYQRTSDVKLGSHVVKCIGWGSENGVDYWLIANSWGTKWGEDGFFKLKRDTNELGIYNNNLAANLDIIPKNQESELKYVQVLLRML